MGQSTIASAEIPTVIIEQFCTIGVDARIFRSGTLTVYGDQLDYFNQSIYGEIQIMRDIR